MYQTGRQRASGDGQVDAKSCTWGSVDLDVVRRELG